MRTTLLLLLLLAVPTGALAQTWEYHVEEVDLVTKVRVFANDQLLTADDLAELLGPLGEEGWELTLSIPRGGTTLLLVFKRPVHPCCPGATTPPPEEVPPPPEPAPGAPPAAEPGEADEEPDVAPAAEEPGAESVR